MLGLTIDGDRLAQAHALYQEHGLGSRDDAVAMQAFVPGWTFDPNRPCMVRWAQRRPSDQTALVHRTGAVRRPRAAA
ncbi:hypothetical protein ACWDHH_12250 [Janibacter hoylei]